MEMFHYALEGSIYSSGNIIQWLRDKMKFFDDAKESEKYINASGNSNNVLFLPAFNGLGAPFWDSNIRAGFKGITQDTIYKRYCDCCISFNSIPNKRNYKSIRN